MRPSTSRASGITPEVVGVLVKRSVCWSWVGFAIVLSEIRTSLF